MIACPDHCQVKEAAIAWQISCVRAGVTLAQSGRRLLAAITSGAISNKMVIVTVKQKLANALPRSVAIKKRVQSTNLKLV